MTLTTQGLFWKLAGPILFLFAATIAFMFFHVPATIEQAVVDDAVVNAQRTVGQLKLLRAYYTQHVVKKALEDSNLRVCLANSYSDPKVSYLCTSSYSDRLENI